VTSSARSERAFHDVVALQTVNRSVMAGWFGSLAVFASRTSKENASTNSQFDFA
jgi:hypothetical protein